MSLQKLMHNYAAYDLWANQTLATWLGGKPFALLTKECPSSFASIINTLAHLLDTEKFWLAVLQGSASQPWQAFGGTDDEVIRALLQQSGDFYSYVHSLGETDLASLCELDTHWAKGQMPKYEFIQHCINHGSYHRGQVITIARNVGITDAPNTDYNYYNMVVKH